MADSTLVPGAGNLESDAQRKTFAPWLSKAAVFAVTLSAMFLGTLVAASADEYVGGSPAEAVFVAWTSDQSGHLQGQLQVVSLDSANSAAVKRTSAAFTGTRNGSDVSLAFGVLSAFSGQTWTGRIGFRSLVLELPTNAAEHLTSGSFEDFQRLVGKLQGNANGAAARNGALQSVNDIEAQMRAAGKQLTGGMTDLALLFPSPPPDPSSPNAFSHKYLTQMAKMQADWTREQAQANVVPLTCYAKSQVSYIASQVSYDLSQFAYLDSQFNAANDRVNRDMAGVTNGYASLRNLYPIYVQRIHVRQQLVPNSPGPAFSFGSIEQAQQSATIAMNLYRARFAVLRGTIQDTDQRAKTLSQRADAFPETLSCSD